MLQKNVTNCVTWSGGMLGMKRVGGYRPDLKFYLLSYFFPGMFGIEVLRGNRPDVTKVNHLFSYFSSGRWYARYGWASWQPTRSEMLLLYFSPGRWYAWY
jgi:hypothetical protein